jgi:hypothetical protein
MNASPFDSSADSLAEISSDDLRPVNKNSKISASLEARRSVSANAGSSITYMIVSSTTGTQGAVLTVPHSILARADEVIE